jgi:hypothetical protein
MLAPALAWFLLLTGLGIFLLGLAKFIDLWRPPPK